MSNDILLRIASGRDIQAQVVSIEDPSGLKRVQVRPVAIMDGIEDVDLPWAEVLLPPTARTNEGEWTPFKGGDWVWVDFPYWSHSEVDIRRPRITGSVHLAPDGVLNLPHEAFSGEQALVPKRADGEPEAAERDEQTKVVTLHGITIEILQAGVYRITHRDSGTSFELSDNSLLHTEGDNYLSSTGKTQMQVGNSLTIKVLEGDANIDVSNGSAIVKASDKATVDAPIIELGKSGTDEPLILGKTFMEFFNKCQWPTPLGPTGMVITPMTNLQLSDVSSTTKAHG